MAKTLWHALPEAEILQLLNTTKNGLSPEEARQRLKKFGLNKLPAAPRASWLLILFNQYKSPLIYILLVAGLVSFILAEYIDMAVILAAVFINTLVGFIQEFKAEKTLAFLKKIVIYKSKVLRDGNIIRINSEQLTVGDILILETGDKVGADARIIELNDLQTNEASLTGESLPVEKELGILDKGVPAADRKNMVFMGTTISRGRARAVVTDIGADTSIGEIASLVKETAEAKTPLQYKLVQFSRILGLVVLAASVLIFVVGILLGNEIFMMFETAVAVAVSAIPEGLMVSVTIILAVGMQRILRQRALVRKLVAAETLGSVSVICSDKTGTLTLGEMRVAHLLTGDCDPKNIIDMAGKKDAEQARDYYFLLSLGLICNNSFISISPDEGTEEFIGEATEIALLRAGIDAGLDDVKLRKNSQRLAELPFSTEVKYMATLNHYNEQNNVVYLKGAPEIIINYCDRILFNGKVETLAADMKSKIQRHISSLTASGLRVLAAAYRPVDNTKKDLITSDINDSIFVGVFALKDPLRPEAKETISLCKMAGLQPIIITGDHPLTVKKIAEEIGLKVTASNILEGKDLDQLSDEEFNKKVKDYIIYARVSPKHKLRIVAAWQANGEVVAMLGDGVNDAPALKNADVGVALGSGTDVAKEISDLVLLDNNFYSIVAAVKQGRIIYENIKKVITYLLAASFTEIILVVCSLLASLPLPVIALQILFVNVITDSFPAIALTFEPGEKDIMRQKPIPKQAPIISPRMKFVIFFIGLLTDFILFALFVYLLRLNFSLDHVRTIIFTTLSFSSLLYIFSIKSLRKNIWQVNPFNNKYLLLAVALGVIIQIFVLTAPFMREALQLVVIGYNEAIFIGALALLKIVFIEIGKLIYNRRFGSTVLD